MWWEMKGVKTPSAYMHADMETKNSAFRHKAQPYVQWPAKPLWVQKKKGFEVYE